MRYLLFIALLLAGCSGGGTPSTTPTPGRPAAPVSVGTSKQGAVEERVAVTGHLKPLEEADVSAQLMRKVERVAVRLGDHVYAGEPVIWLDSADLNAQVGQAAATVRASEAGVTRAASGAPLTSVEVDVNLERARDAVETAASQRMRAQHELDDALADLKRKQSLFAQDAIPKVQQEQADLRYHLAQRAMDAARIQEDTARDGVRLARAGRLRNTVSQAEVAQAQAGVGQSSAALQAAEVQVGYTVLKAPISGIVVERKVEPGQTVGPGTGRLLKIVNNRELELVGPVPERYLAWLKTGQTARLTSALDHTATARLTTIVPASDPTTHTVQVRMRVRDPKLVTGLYVEASLLIREHRGVLVPRSAVLAEKGERYVLQVEGETVKRHNVTVIYETEDQSVLGKGLVAGVKVVTGGGEGLADGAAVRVP